MPWRKVLVTTVVAGALMQAATALLWMNPLTQRIILTPEFGQSQKLINVWRLWEPLPRLIQQPSFAMIGGFLLFTLLHVLVYLHLAPVLPGKGWSSTATSSFSRPSTRAAAPHRL